MTLVRKLKQLILKYMKTSVAVLKPSREWVVEMENFGILSRDSMCYSFKGKLQNLLPYSRAVPRQKILDGNHTANLLVATNEDLVLKTLDVILKVGNRGLSYINQAATASTC